MISLVDVRKRYRDGDERIEAVRGLNLEIPAGELHVLVGPSGSGKSTVLGLMGSLILPTGGTVVVDGTEVTHLRDHHRTEFRQRVVGYVFQELSLIESMSTLENVMLPLIPGGGATQADHLRARKLLDRFGLSKEGGRRASRLSGGQRQRAAIARAMILEPRVLLLDEPTAHLDTLAARAVLGLLVELKNEGRTLVVATHDARLFDDPRVDRVHSLVDGNLRHRPIRPRAPNR